MVCVGLYLRGMKVCQIDVWCPLPSSLPPKLGCHYETLGPEDGEEVVTVTGTGRDSGGPGSRVSLWGGTRQ